MVNINYKDVYIKDFYSISGTQENNGNLKNVNRYLKDYYDGEKTIEDCEIKLQKEVLKNLTNNNTDLIVGGDLSNQITTTNSSVSNKNISFLGMQNTNALTIPYNITLPANLKKFAPTPVIKPSFL